MFTAFVKKLYITKYTVTHNRKNKRVSDHDCFVVLDKENDKINQTLYLGRNHDGVIARRGIISQGLLEEKPLLALHGNSSLGFRSPTSGEFFPLLMCLKICYEITANAHVHLLSQ